MTLASLLLEYALGMAAVARGFSSNLASLVNLQVVPLRGAGSTSAAVLRRQGSTGALLCGRPGARFGGASGSECGGPPVRVVTSCCACCPLPPNAQPRDIRMTLWEGGEEAHTFDLVAAGIVLFMSLLLSLGVRESAHFISGGWVAVLEGWMRLGGGVSC